MEVGANKVLNTDINGPTDVKHNKGYLEHTDGCMDVQMDIEISKHTDGCRHTDRHNPSSLYLPNKPNPKAKPNTYMKVLPI